MGVVGSRPAHRLGEGPTTVPGGTGLRRVGVGLGRVLKLSRRRSTNLVDVCVRRGTTLVSILITVGVPRFLRDWPSGDYDRSPCNLHRPTRPSFLQERGLSDWGESPFPS